MKSRTSRRAFLGMLAALPAVTSRRAGAAAPLRIGLNPVDATMEPYYALELGLFANAALDVEISRVTSGAAGLEGLAGGTLDLGITSVGQMAAAALNGVAFKYVVGGPMWNTSAPVGGLVVAADSPILGARDFEGKTIAVIALGDLTHLSAVAYLIKGGADPAKVHFIELPFPAILPAVSGGRIAGGVCVVPFMPVAGDGTRVLTPCFNAVADHYMELGFMCTDAWARENAPLAHRFAAVIYQAARWANDKANHDRSAEIVEKYTKASPEVMARAVRATYAESLEPWMIQSTLDWEYRANFTSRRVLATELIAVV